MRVLLIVLLAAAGLAAQEPTPALRPSFPEWLEGVRVEALARGIRQEILDQAFEGLTEPVADVIERDRRQPEVVLTLEQYLSQLVTERRIAAGREAFIRHRTLLDQVGERYGIAPHVLVAVWGLESNFGQTLGTRPTIASLATLAWDPRRSALFRRELLDALEILNRGDIDLANLRGSWAGAMGQPQFLPSSYLRFAEDFDGDGRRDIWLSTPDILASMANYLKAHQWTVDERWGREVQLPAEAARRIAAGVERRTGGCGARRTMTVALPMARWQELGVRLPGGDALPESTLNASLVSGTSRTFLVYGNYEALLDYNCAHSYAISVGLLADAVR